ncbi:MAG: polyphosphate polymerase domain-containing protein [Clostridia bacterium]|nr:polyphosphate polymerase domain-containing protein [Clostridia bacterium]
MEQKPVYRHEEKYLITAADRIVLSSRLNAVISRDLNTDPDGTYRIRSLYFDDPENSAFHDSLDGVYRKQKYRIRMYNNNSEMIFIEKKIKSDKGGIKLREKISATELRSLTNGNYDFLLNKDSAVCRDFYSALRCGIRPVSIVDYRRTAFFSQAGNVRITIDDEIRSFAFSGNFFDPSSSGVNLTDKGQCILEIKYDAFLPDHIKKLIGIRDMFRCGFSKYSTGRNTL